MGGRVNSNILDSILRVKSAVSQVEVDLIENVARSITVKHFHSVERAMAALAAALEVDKNGSVDGRANFYPIRSR
jgi:hypothetical protein